MIVLNSCSFFTELFCSVLNFIEMYADYTSLVLLKYKNGLKADQLPPRLISPTPGSLRDECATLCKYRFDNNDQRILRDFFGHHDNQKSYIQAIEAFDINKFRPLLKFITGKITTTSQKNIELLAWLVDVQPRPYRNDFDYEQIDLSSDYIPVENRVATCDVALKGDVNQSPAIKGPLGIVDSSKNEISRKLLLFDRRRIFIAGGILTLIISAITGLWLVGLQSGNCMYWDGDHYELVACDKKMPNMLVIAANNTMLRDFKKITRVDTITAAALGHVWYSKINNFVEYFTADGFHPVHIQYHLKPLTQYMIAHHLQPQP